MIVHGIVPRESLISSILPIPKNKLSGTANSDNYRGIAPSSILGKILDHVILSKCCEKLCTSDQQFGFKRKSSIDMCTMVLKVTLTYYTNNRSTVFFAHFLMPVRRLTGCNIVNCFVYFSIVMFPLYCENCNESLCWTCNWCYVEWTFF